MLVKEAPVGKLGPSCITQYRDDYKFNHVQYIASIMHIVMMICILLCFCMSYQFWSATYDVTDHSVM